MPQVPIAVTQAAVLKSAAGKQAQAPAVESTQVGAVKQDLAVMADQAKGYTQGINAGIITAQDNRAAQARRLAAEKAANDAARAQEAQMAAIQQQEARLRQQAQAQQFERDKQELQIRQAVNETEETQEPNAEAARRVIFHSKANRTPNFQDALVALLQDSTSAQEAVAILKNAKANDEDWAEGIHEGAIRQYATAYFSALEGRAASLSRLPKRRS